MTLLNQRKRRCGYALLEHGLHRIHDPGVDIAELSQREQIVRMLDRIELVGGRLIDRCCYGVGRGSAL
jgi:hypothetical protein